MSVQKKLHAKLSYEYAARKMLVKLAPDVYFLGVRKLLKIFKLNYLVIKQKIPSFVLSMVQKVQKSCENDEKYNYKFQDQI